MVSVFDDHAEDDEGYIEAMAKLEAINGARWSEEQRAAIFDVLLDLVTKMRLVHLYRMKYPEKRD